MDENKLHPHEHTHDEMSHFEPSHRHSHHHSPEAKKKQINRLSRAIGHLQHVKSMIENDADCAEVLIQLAAVRSALNSLGKEIVNEHIEHCIYHAVQDGDTEALDDFKDAVRKFM